MKLFFIFFMSCMLSVGLTPLVRWVAICHGYVAQPNEDRWHKIPTPAFGGIAIFFSFLIALFVVQASEGLNPFLWAFLMGSGMMFVLGLLDDFLHIQPYSKLIGQIIATSFILMNELGFDIPSFPLLGVFLTFLWIVGITNAFNLLDNMDGLSAGTGAIVALCLLCAGLMTGNELVAICAAGLCGALIGFLRFNFYPAKIFMGDSGSLFLGFSLATLAITGKGEYSTNIFFAILIPVLVLAVPIFDTTFVALLRLFNGKAISQGGRDHTSHRLVAFGLSEKTTVLLFYAMSLVCGVVALLGLKFSMLYPSILAILIVIVFCYFGVFLSGIVAYGEKAEQLVNVSRGFRLNLFLMHKKRIGEVIVDSILICGSFACAFIIRFDGLPSEYVQAIVHGIPLLLPLKLGVFFYFGLYRGLWRYVGMQDLLNILKAVTVGGLISVVVMVMVFRFEGYPRSVFVIDWMILLLAVTGVRVLVKFFEQYLGYLAEPKGKRVLIVGAGDTGEIALREMKSQPQLGYLPVGFIDDDSKKWGHSIHGVPILGSMQDLGKVVSDHRIEEVLIAMPSPNGALLDDLLKDCREMGVVVRVKPQSVSWVEPAYVG